MSSTSTHLPLPPTFIMPHYSSGIVADWHSFLIQAINSVLTQTDPDFHLVIIDDYSPEPARTIVQQCRSLSPKIDIILLDQHVGAGLTRNAGIAWASERGAPFLLFIDADDVCHPDRLKVMKQIFHERPEASVVYSTFEVIDENNQSVPRRNLSPMLVEHLEAHECPPEGKNAWIRIVTETGYTNLTSSTAVLTSLARAVPFCPSKAFEDGHCWIRYSAAGGYFVFTPLTPTLYRVPQQSKSGGSASRALLGRPRFYSTLSVAGEDAFNKAVQMCLTNHTLSLHQVDGLRAAYYVRMAETLSKEKMLELAQLNITKALLASREMTLLALDRRNLSKNEWVQNILTFEGIKCESSKY